MSNNIYCTFPKNYQECLREITHPTQSCGFTSEDNLYLPEGSDIVLTKHYGGEYRKTHFLEVLLRMKDLGYEIPFELFNVRVEPTEDNLERLKSIGLLDTQYEDILSSQSIGVVNNLPFDNFQLFASVLHSQDDISLIPIPQKHPYADYLKPGSEWLHLGSGGVKTLIEERDAQLDFGSAVVSKKSLGVDYIPSNFYINLMEYPKEQADIIIEKLNNKLGPAGVHKIPLKIYTSRYISFATNHDRRPGNPLSKGFDVPELDIKLLLGADFPTFQETEEPHWEVLFNESQILVEDLEKKTQKLEEENKNALLDVQISKDDTNALNEQNLELKSQIEDKNTQINKLTGANNELDHLVKYHEDHISKLVSKHKDTVTTMSNNTDFWIDFWIEKYDGSVAEVQLKESKIRELEIKNQELQTKLSKVWWNKLFGVKV